MTFSDTRIVDLVRENFVPVWESVAPVKVAVFDLGDGKSVRSTVGGEIALYFCRPDGKVFDILPALHSPHTTYWAIKNALAFYQETGATPTAVDSYHRQMLALRQKEQSTQQVREKLADAHRTLSYRVSVKGGTAALAEMVLSKSGLATPSETVIVVEPGGRELYKHLVHAAFVSEFDALRPTDAAGELVDEPHMLRFLAHQLEPALRTPEQWKVPLFEGILGQELVGGETVYDVNTLSPMSLTEDR